MMMTPSYNGSIYSLIEHKNMRDFVEQGMSMRYFEDKEKRVFERNI